MEKGKTPQETPTQETPQGSPELTFSIPIVVGIAALALLFGGVGGYLIGKAQKPKSITVNEIQDQIQADNQPSSTINEISDAANNCQNAADTDFTFSSECGYYGKVELEGYVKIEPTLEAFCDSTVYVCETYQYVFFEITSSDNEAIFDLLDRMQGNAYYRGNSIGVGCYDETAQKITSESHSDEGAEENVIDGLSLERLLLSSKTNPIVLRAVMPVFTGGSSGPTCYSGFRYFEVFLPHPSSLERSPSGCEVCEVPYIDNTSTATSCLVPPPR